jgi:hypothetical protein
MLASEIETIVNKLLELKKEYSIEYINTLDEFKEFRTTQRMFYETILSDSFDPVIFKMMMENKRKIENGADSYAIDVEFGQYMAERYIPESLRRKV